MSFPTVKTIAARLKVDDGTAKRVRALMDGSRDPLEYKGVQCVDLQGHMSRIERQLHAIDIEIDGHGVEPVVDDTVVMEYINLGDTYDTTVIYDYTRSRWLVMSWGDWVEREERNGRKFA